MNALRLVINQMNPAMQEQVKEKLAALPRRTHLIEGGRKPQPKKKNFWLLKHLSEPAERLAFHMRAEGIRYRREYEFWPGRKYRADFAVMDAQLLIEVDGGIWTRGRHVRPQGFEEDQIKRNEATLLGWRVLNFTPTMVSGGQAINAIKRFLDKNNWEGTCL